MLVIDFPVRAGKGGNALPGGAQDLKTAYLLRKKFRTMPMSSAMNLAKKEIGRAHV